MPCPGPKLGALALALITMLPRPALDAATWRKLVTPQFTIVTDASDGMTHDVATDLADFQLFLDRTLVVKAADRKPLTIVLFDDDTEFTPFKPLAADGKSIDDIQRDEGLHTTSNTESGSNWTVIVTAAQMREAQTRFGVFNGAVYWYLETLGEHAPLAVRHGVATVLSTYRRQLTHGELGATIPTYIPILDHWSLMPVQALLAQHDTMKLVESHDRLLFEAEAWAFVHYLMFSKGPMQRHAFDLFWQALNAGASPHDALVHALGAEGADAVDVDLTNYLHSTRYVAKIAMGEKIRNRDPIVPAETVDVELALAKAALIGHRELALQHADAAIAAAGARPEPFELRAEILRVNRAPAPEVRTAVDDAITRHSRNAVMYLWSAQYELKADPGPSGSSITARSAVNLAEKAITLDHRLQPAFELLAQTIGRADHVTDDDGKFLAFGRLRFPQDRWLLAGESAFSRQRGDAAAAQHFRDLALADDPALDHAQLAPVREFLSANR